MHAIYIIYIPVLHTSIAKSEYQWAIIDFLKNNFVDMHACKDTGIASELMVMLKQTKKLIHWSWEEKIWSSHKK